MYDAVILSDLHLGSPNCQAKALCDLLESLDKPACATAKLILNGDVFDSFDFRRLQKHHWRVLSLLRKLSDHIEIIWICGNHDGSAEIVSHLLGVKVVDEHVLWSGGKKVLVLHGHLFDDWLEAHPILTWIGDMIYLFLQRIDRTHHIAKVAKQGSKTFIQCAQKIKKGSIEYAAQGGFDAVCCGHTHHATRDHTQKVAYYNSGCWTENPCTFLIIQDGEIRFDYRCGDDQDKGRRKQPAWLGNTGHEEQWLADSHEKSTNRILEVPIEVFANGSSKNGHNGKVKHLNGKT